MLKFKKTDRYKLSANFSTHEFACHCNYSDCEEQTLSKTLVDKIQRVRDNFGKSLTITSACRCVRKQADLRNDPNFKTAVNKSTHQMNYVDSKGNVGCIALDVRPSKVESSKDMDDLLKCLEKEFTSIGTANNFFHVDEREGIRRWVY